MDNIWNASKGKKKQQNLSQKNKTKKTMKTNGNRWMNINMDYVHLYNDDIFTTIHLSIYTFII